METDLFIAQAKNINALQRSDRLELQIIKSNQAKSSVDGVRVTITGYNAALGKVLAQTDTGRIISAENLGSDTITPGTIAMYQPSTGTIDFTTY